MAAKLVYDTAHNFYTKYASMCSVHVVYVSRNMFVFNEIHSKGHKCL